jgi:hypothetical protein
MNCIKEDFIGNKLEVGDSVAFIRGGYAEMRKGKVVGFTPKSIRIEAEEAFLSKGSGASYSAGDKIAVLSSKVAKLPESQLVS